MEKKFLEAIKKLRQERERNFNQTVDLIINLKEFDVRKEAFSLFIQVPNKIKDKKIAGFFEKDSEIIDVIKKDDFSKYKEKKEAKKLVQKYDFFVANAKLMPQVATNFGRVLGPVGKMPSPQIGILPKEDEESIKNLINKINSTVRVKIKEPSVKVSIGKESSKDEEIAQNAETVYEQLIQKLPRKKDNVKNVEIKFSMTKPIKVRN